MTRYTVRLPADPHQEWSPDAATRLVGQITEVVVPPRADPPDSERRYPARIAQARVEGCDLVMELEVK